MSEDLAIELVLQLYTQSYKSPSQPEKKVSVQNGPVGHTAQKPKQTTPPHSSIADKPAPKNFSHQHTSNPSAPTPVIIPHSIPIPKVGTLDATGFILALRHAGMRREISGKLLRHPHLILQDEKLAIAAWVGYSFGKPHGIQLDHARFKARFAIKPERAAEYRRGIAATIAGFVQGAPDLVSRYRNDLLAREQQAAEQASIFEKAMDKAKTEAERTLNQGKMLVERERLSVIRQDLIALVVDKAQSK